MKRFKKFIASLAVMATLFGVVAVPVAHAWQNITRTIWISGGNPVPAHGQWRSYNSCRDHHCTIRTLVSETQSVGWRSVAISNGHPVTAARGQMAQSITTRLSSGNTSGWDLLN